MSSRRGSRSPSDSRTPLRTVRETFASYGSNVSDACPVSLWAARRRCGFCNVQAFVVYLIVAVRVQQHQIVVRVLSAKVFGFDVVPVPSRGFRDRLAAVRAFAGLPRVKVRQQTSPGELSSHFLALATLEIQFVFRVVRVGARFDPLVPHHFDR